MRPRLLVLLFALVGAAAFLVLFEPEKELGYEIYWKVLEQPRLPCGVYPRAQSRWTLVGGDESPAAKRHLRKRLSQCEENCQQEVEVELTTGLDDIPGFFSGYGRALVKLDARRKAPDCADRYVLALDLHVEQGMRGERWIFERVLGDVLYRGLGETFLSDREVR